MAAIPPFLHADSECHRWEKAKIGRAAGRALDLIAAAWRAIKKLESGEDAEVAEKNMESIGCGPPASGELFFCTVYYPLFSRMPEIPTIGSLNPPYCCQSIKIAA